MSDLLTDVLCGLGAMYLAIHVGCFAHTILRRSRPSVPAPAPHPGFNPENRKTETMSHEVRAP